MTKVSADRLWPFAKAESASHLSLQNKEPEEEGRLGTPPRPGTIAEREHKKWENAPPIENNPYSQENIQKRLLERQYSRRSSDIPGITPNAKEQRSDMDVVLAPHEPDIKRFGRDYYINDSRASGNEKGRRSTAVDLEQTEQLVVSTIKFQRNGGPGSTGGNTIQRNGDDPESKQRREIQGGEMAE